MSTKGGSITSFPDSLRGKPGNDARVGQGEVGR